MEEKNNLLIQQEISQNMSVASQQPFAMTNEELAFNAMMANNRNNRKRTSQEKLDQQRNTRDWINRTHSDNILEIRNSENQSRAANDWMRSVNREALQVVHQNNRASSESIDTLRENFRNSQELLKGRSCEALTIEEASLRDRSQSVGSKARASTHSLPDITRKREVGIASAEKKSECSGEKLNEENNPNNTNELKRTETSSKNATENTACDNKRTSGNENVAIETSKGNANENKVVPDNRKSANEDAVADSNISSLENISYKRTCRRESIDSLNDSTYDLSRSYRSLSGKDPHTAAIDLSNNCRKFYFNHMKNAEAIKLSVRSAKHARARDKMEGKPHSSIDDAFDRLRSEMADLMDQDLSLMSQLLKLNDKIEEVKTHIAYRNRPESYDSSQSTWEMSDSEFEENDDSRLDLSNSARNFRPQDMKSLVDSEEPKKEVLLQRLTPADSRIIIYNKKSRRGKKRGRKSRSKTDSEDDTAGSGEDDEEEEEEDDGSESDTESTLSDYSGTTIGSNHSGGTERTSDNVDSGIQSPKTPDKPPDIPKPVVGGVSQNRKFLSFLKKNGNFSAVAGINPVLTLQGHNIPLDKYYVPQDLVYLKHTNSENVFCQFSK